MPKEKESNVRSQYISINYLSVAYYSTRVSDISL